MPSGRGTVSCSTPYLIFSYPSLLRRSENAIGSNHHDSFPRQCSVYLRVPGLHDSRD